MITIAFVGCGHIHTPGFLDGAKKRADVHIAAVWDHDAERANSAAQRVSAPVADSPAAIFNNPAVQGVVICSQTNRHEELVTAAVAAKKHLFVEKPLGFAADDARRMAAAIDNAGLKFQTGYFKRSERINRFLKEQIGRGNFGKITRVRASNCHAGALRGWFDTQWRWMADPKIAGCGAFGDLGTHALDLLIWMLGDVAEVAATLDVGTARYPGCDETGEAILRFKSGVIGTIAAAWDDVADPVTLTISGTEGFAIVSGDQLYFQSEHVPGADGKQPWTQMSPSLPRAFDLFLDALDGQDVPLVSAREAAYRSVVMAAIYQAAGAKTWVATPSSQ